MNFKFLFATLAFLALPISVLAQSNPGIQPNQPPTAAQWNSYFALKTDLTNGLLTNPTINGSVNGNFVITNNPGFVSNVTDGLNSVNNTTQMTFSGATVTNGGGTNALVTINPPNLPYLFVALPPYNVVANGADETLPIQNALNDAAAAGRTVILPAGNITINGTGLNIPAGVNLVGESVNFPTDIVAPGTVAGTVLLSPNATFASGTNPLVTMNANTLIANMVIWGAGSDGFGSGTSRDGIDVSSGNVHIFHVGIYNNNNGVNALLSNPFIESCFIHQNQEGLQNPVQAHIVNSDFQQNITDVFMGNGANANQFIGNRFFGNFSGPSIVLDGSFGSTTTAVTNGATAAANSTLHFAAGPAGAIQGYQVYDVTHPTVIPAGTIITQASPGTTMTMSAAATGAGVLNGDTIEFYTMAVGGGTLFSGNSFDRSSTNEISMQYANHVTISGSNVFSRSGATATSNTSGDAYIRLSHSNMITITGVNTITGLDPINTRNSPSFGVWDDGSNYASIIANSTWMWNPVDTVHGAGINTTATFTTFNSVNTVVQTNPYIPGQP